MRSEIDRKEKVRAFSSKCYCKALSACTRHPLTAAVFFVTLLRDNKTKYEKEILQGRTFANCSLNNSVCFFAFGLGELGLGTWDREPEKRCRQRSPGGRRTVRTIYYVPRKAVVISFRQNNNRF